MLTLIKNAEIHAPEPIGLGHVVTGGGKVLYVGGEEPDISNRLLAETVDLDGGVLIPGLIDCHVHVTGGGGENGFSTQAPPVPLSRFTLHGVTSVIGLSLIHI